MTEFLNYLKENWTMIKANPFVFAIGWFICFVLGYTFASLVHKITDAKWKKKYKDLEESYTILNNDFQALKNKLGKNDNEVLVAGMGRNNSSSISKQMHSFLNQ